MLARLPPAGLSLRRLVIVESSSRTRGRRCATCGRVGAILAEGNRRHLLGIRAAAVFRLVEALDLRLLRHTEDADDVEEAEHDRREAHDPHDLDERHDELDGKQLAARAALSTFGKATPRGSRGGRAEHACADRAQTTPSEGRAAGPGFERPKGP